MQSDRIAGMSRDPRVNVEMTVATAPWFGSCERCNEPKSELGTHGPEVIGRVLPLNAPPGQFDWLCLGHLAEVTREIVHAAFGIPVPSRGMELRA